MASDVDLGNNDFGFSFHDKTDLKPEPVQDANDVIRVRLKEILAYIQPLFDNLKKNPEKDYIYWPNRVAKIEEFERKLKEFTN